jgi:hypothetical protein
MTNTPKDVIAQAEEEWKEKISFASKYNHISDEAEMKLNNDKHFYYPEAYPESIWELDDEKIKDFIFSTYTKDLLQSVEDELREIPADENGKVYKTSVSDIISKLK